MWSHLYDIGKFIEAESRIKITRGEGELESHCLYVVSTRYDKKVLEVGVNVLNANELYA